VDGELVDPLDRLVDPEEEEEEPAGRTVESRADFTPAQRAVRRRFGPPAEHFTPF